MKDVVNAFQMARKLGFDNINMDLIAGLPGENAEDMRDTLSRVKELGPDSLTVHALAIKRAAKFGQEGRTAELHSEISQMVEEASRCARSKGLQPLLSCTDRRILPEISRMWAMQRLTKPEFTIY